MKASVISSPRRRSRSTICTRLAVSVESPSMMTMKVTLAMNAMAAAAAWPPSARPIGRQIAIGMSTSVQGSASAPAAWARYKVGRGIGSSNRRTALGRSMPGTTMGPTIDSAVAAIVR